jgi:hypothetical protein
MDENTRAENTRAGVWRVFGTDRHNDSLWRDGYAVVDFLEPEQVSELKTAWDRAPDPAGLAYTSTAFNPDLAYRRRMFEQIAAVFEGPARRLLPGYRLCLGGFIRKRAADHSGTVQLHQDPTIVDERRFVSINIWCPLVDVDESNGCLRVVPGSHVFNRGPRDCANIDFPYPELLSSITAECVVDVPLGAGQAFCYTQSLFHSSPPNLTARERLVAGCMAVPKEAELMIFMSDPIEHPGLLSAYQVSDEVFRDYRLGTRPDASLRAGFVELKPEQFGDEPFAQLIQRRHADRSI